MFKNVLVVTDNAYLALGFLRAYRGIENCPPLKFAISSGSNLQDYYDRSYECSVLRIDLNDSSIQKQLLAEYDLIFSLHCKQMFPAVLVRNIRCINIHPGLNPFTRGWYPQVQGIIYNRKIGATIHEMDEKLDHGPIIARVEVPIRISDTSKSIYERILDAELGLIQQCLPAILENKYTTVEPEQNGVLFLRRDFDALCHIDLNEVGRFGDFLDRLRALTHPPFKNAYFINPLTDSKVFVEVRLHEEDGYGR